MVAASDLAYSFANTLRRAHGWLELGCIDDAFSQLEELPDTLHCSREVLKLKCKILSAGQRWNELRKLAETAAKYYPQESAFTEDWAWAEHKSGRSLEGYSILLEHSRGSNTTWRTAYFLACLAHTLRQTQEAAQWLGHAFLLHSSPAQLKQQAMREEVFRS